MKHITKHHLLILAFNLVYIAIFGLLFFQDLNLEFILYMGVLVFFLLLIGLTLHKSKFPNHILWGLSLWGLLHVAGGGVVVNEQVLYTLELIPLVGSGESFILKYDQMVHFFGFFISGLVMIHLLKLPFRGIRVPLVIFFAGALSSMGLSVINEIIEFIVVISFSEHGVGGYYNLSIDLVFNTLGASFAMALAYFLERRRARGKVESTNFS